VVPAGGCYKNKVTAIMPSLNRAIVPNTIRSQISTITYRVFTFEEQSEEQFSRELSGLVIEYVPAYIRQAGHAHLHELLDYTAKA
jgi:hypothetical protein